MILSGHRRRRQRPCRTPQTPRTASPALSPHGVGSSERRVSEISAVWADDGPRARDYGSRTITGQNTRSKKATRETASLTSAETRVLSLLPTYRTLAVIGTELDIGRPTVKTHVETSTRSSGLPSAPKRSSWLRPQASCPPVTDDRLPIGRRSEPHTLALAGARAPSIGKRPERDVPTARKVVGKYLVHSRPAVMQARVSDVSVPLRTRRAYSHRRGGCDVSCWLRPRAGDAQARRHRRSSSIPPPC